jgi:hypothetical protein
MSEIPPDQITAHESVIDEGHVGRFSRGLELRPQTPAKLHRGRFSEGLERLPESMLKRRPGGYADGLARQVDAIRRLSRGSFADGLSRASAARQPRRAPRARA